MKTILHTLIAVAAFLIQTSSVQGQYTYQTAKRFATSTNIFTDSNTIVQAGVGIGCASVTTQPVWVTFGFCTSGSFPIHFDPQWVGSTGTVAMSVVIYGPFSDTLNLASKLTIANIYQCSNAGYGGAFLNLSNYQRGDIYIFLATSNTQVTKIVVSKMGGAPYLEVDSAFCPFCNGVLSELYQPLCTVTFDSASQKNKIIWSKDIFTPAQDNVIFRKNGAGTFDTLAFQSISQLSEFVDSTSVPAAQPYVYKLGIRDSCGQFINKSNIGNAITPSFTTIHLIAYPISANSAGLIWNPGSFNGPFFIYRTDPAGVTTLIDSIAIVGMGNQTYTDVNAPAGLCSYQIGVHLNNPCVPNLLPSYTIVKSNPGYVTVTGINELADLSKAISIEPNPFNQFTKVDLHLITKQNLKVVLRNLTGQVVMQFDNVKTDELIIERNNLSQGLYFLEVTGDGFYARKKVVVN